MVRNLRPIWIVIFVFSPKLIIFLHYFIILLRLIFWFLCVMSLFIPYICFYRINWLYYFINSILLISSVNTLCHLLLNIFSDLIINLIFLQSFEVSLVDYTREFVLFLLVCFIFRLICFNAIFKILIFCFMTHLFVLFDFFTFIPIIY